MCRDRSTFNITSKRQIAAIHIDARSPVGTWIHIRALDFGFGTFIYISTEYVAFHLADSFNLRHLHKYLEGDTERHSEAGASEHNKRRSNVSVFPFIMYHRIVSDIVLSESISVVSGSSMLFDRKTSSRTCIWSSQRAPRTGESLSPCISSIDSTSR